MKLTYRPDIEGLRAVAVVPVALFHAAPMLVPGGYVGVDIFFVISGFLITSLLLKRFEAGEYSIASFYRARIRRIFPALFFMLGVSSLVACAVLPPKDLAEFGKTLVATALFVSNFQFLSGAGYFAGSSELKPLLHTWSLAVEEQFYIFYPLLLAVIFRRFRSFATWLFVAVLVVSLAVSEWAASRYPTFNFYFSGTRAFELLIGAALAMKALPAISRNVTREVLSTLGLLLIAVSLFMFGKNTPFPGLNALVPCVGAGLLIYSGSYGASLVGRCLSIPPVRWIGLVSYSLYLWHWPFIVFVRHYSLGEPPPLALAAALAAAVLMSAVSLRFVERPFRRISDQDRRLFVFGALAIVLAVAAGGLLKATDGWPGRFDPEANRLFAGVSDVNPLRKKCHGEPLGIIPYENNCVFGDAAAPPSVVVWGDSHGAELAVALGDVLAAQKVSVMQITASGCPPVQGFRNRGRPFCAEHNRETLLHLVADQRVRTVVIIARYTAYLGADDGFGAGLSASVAALNDAGKKVMLLTPIPEFPYSVPMALGMLQSRGEAFGSYAVSRRDFEGKNAEAMLLLRSIQAEGRSTLIRIEDEMCRDDRCEAYIGGEVMYFDDNHLSVTGARRVARSIDGRLKTGMDD